MQRVLQNEHKMRVKTQAKMMRSQEFRVETFLLFGFVFFKAGSHESLKWPGTPYVHQVGLEFRDLPTSVPQVLELKAWTTMPGSFKNVHSFFPLVFLR